MEARYMNGHRKGSSFERKICVRLSEWWSQGVEGEKRQDIFWRSSQSGGRATQRAKSGKKTFGSYGDIAAVDPAGAPLLSVFTIELKRGKSHGDIGDLLDIPLDAAWRPFELTLQQVIGSAESAESRSWLIISQRDRRRCMVYGNVFLRVLSEKICSVRLFRPIRDKDLEPIKIYFMPFDRFLKQVKPAEIIKLNNQK